MRPHQPDLTGTDQGDILALNARYAHALDRHDWNRLASVLAPKATMEFAGLPAATGPEAVAAVCAGALEPVDSSQHLMGSALLEVYDDAVTVSSYFDARHVRTIDGQTPLFTVVGTYEDHVERRPEG